MYSNCIFCTNLFPPNNTLENFPLGRRVVFDPARGRIWLVCGRCERWNLSPLETRWEGVEEAERSFRGSRVRVATDNIALARVHDAVELVRIGVPPPIEMAVWRYGDQFGRRRRKALAIAAVGTGTGLLHVGMVAAGAVSGGVAIGMVAALSSWAALLGSVPQFVRDRHDRKVPVLRLRDERDREHPLVASDIRGATLQPIGGDGWRLTVSRKVKPNPTIEVGERRDRGVTMIADRELLSVPAVDTYTMLGAMLPIINHEGGSKRRVRDAMTFVDRAANVKDLLRLASEFNNPNHEELHVASLPTPVRLGLEMVLHGNDERRAMEGELAELERRWRDAEEIAAISDSLLVPGWVESKLRDMRGA
jgi:hypothetical protein